MGKLRWLPGTGLEGVDKEPWNPSKTSPALQSLHRLGFPWDFPFSTRYRDCDYFIDCNHSEQKGFSATLTRPGGIHSIGLGSLHTLLRQERPWERGAEPPAWQGQADLPHQFPTKPAPFQWFLKAFSSTKWILFLARRFHVTEIDMLKKKPKQTTQNKHTNKKQGKNPIWIL